MKRFALLFPVIIIVLCSYGQNNLSRSGAAHLRAAEILSSSATSTDDKLQVAEEYEKVIQADPYFAKAYLEAAKIYSALTPELGTSAYDKAKSLLNNYADLMPSNADQVDTELIVLDAMLSKYNNGPAKLDGIWSWWSTYTRTYTDYLEVRNSGSGYTVRLVDASNCFTSPGYGNVRDVDISVNGDNCSIVVQVFHDERSRLREKGWRKFVDDCDGNADPGFPRHGEYYYNESLTTWYFKVDLSRVPLIMECEKIHTDYYFDGNNTYSDTDRNGKVFKKELVKRK